MSEWIKIANVDDLIEETCNIFETDLGPILLIKSEGDGIIRALSGVCSHEDYVLETGFVQENSIICPLHLSAFDLDTGEALNPPAEKPLEVYDIKTDNNIIFIKKKEK